MSDQERTGLAALTELSERLSLVRAEALHLLGRNWPPKRNDSQTLWPQPPAVLSTAPILLTGMSSLTERARAIRLSWPG